MPDVTDTLTNTQLGLQMFVDPQVATISVSNPTWPADGTTDVVTVTVLDSLLNPVSGRKIKLFTNPSGGTGDNTTSITGSNGEAIFNVNSMVIGFITYTFQDIS